MLIVDQTRWTSRPCSASLVALPAQAAWKVCEAVIAAIGWRVQRACDARLPCKEVVLVPVVSPLTVTINVHLCEIVPGVTRVLLKAATRGAGRAQVCYATDQIVRLRTHIEAMALQEIQALPIAAVPNCWDEA